MNIRLFKIKFEDSNLNDKKLQRVPGSFPVRPNAFKMIKQCLQRTIMTF